MVGQSLEDDEKGKGKSPKTMTGWFTLLDNGKGKGKGKAPSNNGRTLVVIG